MVPSVGGRERREEGGGRREEGEGGRGGNGIVGICDELKININEHLIM